MSNEQSPYVPAPVAFTPDKQGKPEFRVMQNTTQEVEPIEKELNGHLALFRDRAEKSGDKIKKTKLSALMFELHHASNLDELTQIVSNNKDIISDVEADELQKIIARVVGSPTTKPTTPAQQPAQPVQPTPEKEIPMNLGVDPERIRHMTSFIEGSYKEPWLLPKDSLIDIVSHIDNVVDFTRFQNFYLRTGVPTQTFKNEDTARSYIWEVIQKQNFSDDLRINWIQPVILSMAIPESFLDNPTNGKEKLHGVLDEQAERRVDSAVTSLGLASLPVTPIDVPVVPHTPEPPLHFNPVPQSLRVQELDPATVASLSDTEKIELEKQCKETLKEARAVYAQKNVEYKNKIRQQKNWFGKVAGDLGFGGRTLSSDVLSIREDSTKTAMEEAEEAYILAKKNIALFKQSDRKVVQIGVGDGSKKIEASFNPSMLQFSEQEFNELQKVIQESQPELEKGIISKSLEAVAKTNPWARRIISAALITGTTTALGYITIPAAGVAFAGRVARSAIGSSASMVAGKYVDGIYKKGERARTEAQEMEFAATVDMENFARKEREMMRFFEKETDRKKRERLFKAGVMLATGAGVNSALLAFDSQLQNAVESVKDSVKHNADAVSSRGVPKPQVNHDAPKAPATPKTTEKPSPFGADHHPPQKESVLDKNEDAPLSEASDTKVTPKPDVSEKPQPRITKDSEPPLSEDTQTTPPVEKPEPKPFALKQTPAEVPKPTAEEVPFAQTFEATDSVKVVVGTDTYVVSGKVATIISREAMSPNPDKDIIQSLLQGHKAQPGSALGATKTLEFKPWSKVDQIMMNAKPAVSVPQQPEDNLEASVRTVQDPRETELVSDDKSYADNQWSNGKMDDQVEQQAQQTPSVVDEKTARMMDRIEKDSLDAPQEAIAGSMADTHVAGIRPTEHLEPTPPRYDIESDQYGIGRGAVQMTRVGNTYAIYVDKSANLGKPTNGPIAEGMFAPKGELTTKLPLKPEYQFNPQLKSVRELYNRMMIQNSAWGKSGKFVLYPYNGGAFVVAQEGNTAHILLNGQEIGTARIEEVQGTGQGVVDMNSFKTSPQMPKGAIVVGVESPWLKAFKDAQNMIATKQPRFNVQK